MKNPRHDSAVQRRISQKSGWRKGAFCCTPKARQSHEQYRANGRKNGAK
ncbi:hypothetical protein [Pseudoxanthomonas mexicana]|nr:hypothetical protein [Pseudoxanthomonas mexicana]